MTDSSFKDANILIVDDKVANIDVLAGLLEMQGYTHVKSTTDPRLVAGIFQSFHPDLILLDLMMPHLSGYGVMNQLKEFIPENTYLPILVLTADITMEAKQRALSHGAKDFLAKPFDLIEVGLRIENLLFARYLHLQLQNQNEILEEKVSERTIELEKTNIALIAARDKAEESDRLKSAFMRNISHEIRTPLNGILGIYRVLSDDGLSQPEKAEYFTYLRSSSDRLIKTVTDIIDISLLVSGNMPAEETTFSPVGLLEEIYDHYRNSCRLKQLSFNLLAQHVDIGFQICSSAEPLRKALVQLVDNAVKFTEKGGVSVGIEQKGTGLEFYVSDTGIGIDDEAQATIFNPFIQENLSHNRGYEGSGLGLTIAKKCVELIGGQVSFHSEKGKGSTFCITIPYLP
ncbi:MAG: ATP-binding protein [Bacteroidetes bacterium]|nr:ATP-binding protein [Bacteroidota bacterium]